jgi:hypothetical protein
VGPKAADGPAQPPPFGSRPKLCRGLNSAKLFSTYFPRFLNMQIKIKNEIKRKEKGKNGRKQII